MKKFKDFYEAWWFLNEHSAFKYYPNEDLKRNDISFGYFQECLDIDVQKVNPKTKSICKNPELNTHVEIWLECGEYWYNEIAEEWESTHDINLDCGGDTFEEAIIKLANLVLKHYGKGENKCKS